jgi:hypothetical protein
MENLSQNCCVDVTLHVIFEHQSILSNLLSVAKYIWKHSFVVGVDWVIQQLGNLFGNEGDLMVRNDEHLVYLLTHTNTLQRPMQGRFLVSHTQLHKYR